MNAGTSSSTSSPSNLKLWLNLLSVYFIWGSTFLFVHFMTEDMPPLYMAGWRLIVAGIILFSYTKLTKQASPTKEELKSAVLVGVLLLGFSMGGMAVGIQYVPTGIAAILAGLLPLFILVLNWLFFAKSKPSNLALVGLVVGFIGISLLVKPGSFKETSSESWIGIVVIVISDVFWAVGTLLSGRLRMPSQLVSSSIQMLTGGFLLLVISLLVEPVDVFSILDAPSKAIWSLFYLVALGSILGFTSYSWLARNASPQLLSTYAYVNPVVAMFLGWMFAGEILNQEAIIGGVIILVGVVLITLGRR